MRKFFIAGVAWAALIGAVPATAQSTHYHGGTYEQDDDDWNNGGDTYAEFQEEYQHVVQVIQHGLRDRTISRYRAQQFYRELQSIRRAAYYDQLEGGYEGDYVQSRLERLHDRIDATHDRNHERQDRYGDPHGGYRY